MKTKLIGMLVLLATPLVLAQTVTVQLSSTKNNTTVAPGTTVDWSISFTDSTGDNQGLALLCVDLVQDANNPALFDLPAASGVPGAMTNFSRPLGVSNPGEGGPTGYVGVKRGTTGAKNLIQIGGAQNTFGTARSPGSGIAESATVTASVGQSGSVTLASGSFTAPSTAGVYHYSLANAFANVLVVRNNPPAISTTKAATVSISAGTITITVGGASCPGDITGDNKVDLGDLAKLLSNYGLTGTATPSDGDLNGDHNVDLADLAQLLALYGTNC